MNFRDLIALTSLCLALPAATWARSYQGEDLVILKCAVVLQAAAGAGLSSGIASGGEAMLLFAGRQILLEKVEGSPREKDKAMRVLAKRMTDRNDEASLQREIERLLPKCSSYFKR